MIAFLRSFAGITQGLGIGRRLHCYRVGHQPDYYRWPLQCGYCWKQLTED